MIGQFAMQTIKRVKICTRAIRVRDASSRASLRHGESTVSHILAWQPVHDCSVGSSPLLRSLFSPLAESEAWNMAVRVEVCTRFMRKRSTRWHFASGFCVAMANRHTLRHTAVPADCIVKHT